MSGHTEDDGSLAGEEADLLPPSGDSGSTYGTDRLASGNSNTSARKVRLTGLGDSGSGHVTPVETDTDELLDNMATVVAEDYEENGPQHPKLFDESQAGVMELATMITDPDLKRSESSDLLNLSLFQLARDGDVEITKKYLQYMTGNIKKKVNVHDDEDVSPVHYAARYNHVQIVKLLVEAGANANDVDEDGATPLHYAARYKRMRLTVEEGEEGEEATDEGNQDGEDGGTQYVFDSNPENSVIMYLESMKADINSKDTYGCSPLHYAAMRGNEVAAKELLSCTGINIEAVDMQQMTALHLAASHDEKEVVRMLIEQGANLRCVDEDMDTPLHYACMEGSADIVNMLFEAGEKQHGWVTVSQMVSDQDNTQSTALHLAVENQSFEVAKICIEKSANVNTPRENYQTPLHLAATAGCCDIVELLIEHGARIDALDINQETPLYKAAEFNHTDVVEFLLNKGARINRHDKDNFSPLLIAACNGHANTISKLLSRGANIFDVDKNDKTALYWAAEEDHVGALKVLLEHPRSKDLLDLSDRYDNTPLHISAQNGYINCVRLLLDAGGDMDAKNEEEQTPLHLAAISGKTNVVRELVKRNRMVVNDEDEDSNTALHLASLAGHNKVVQTLIDNGADIEARNCSLWTPLDCSAARGWVKTCRVLLEADAPVDPMDKSKTTPLHLASTKGHLDVVNLLIQWQASVTQRDADGNNCLDLAIDNGHKDVAMGIVDSNKWKDALMNETMDIATGQRVTPMRKLIKKQPDVAERVFNRCTTANITNPDHPNYQITFNYEFLDDMYSNWRDCDTASDALSSVDSIYDDEDRLKPDAKAYSSDTAVLKANHPMMLMVQHNQEDLLAHPLVTALLRHKWRSYGRYVYYFNLSLYCVFVAFLTIYIVQAKAPYTYRTDTRNATSNETGGSHCEQVQRYYPNESQHIAAEIAKYIIMCLAAFKILGELFQMYNSKLQYFSYENLVEWVTYVFALLLVVDLNKCQETTGIRTPWQWQLGAIAIFLAWINLVLFIRKMPRFGIYVVMFVDVLYTFVQFFPVFFLFIIAFALAFYALLQNQYEFRNVGISLIKTFVMLIGELEFGDIFLSLEEYDPNSPDAHGNRVFYDVVTYALFCCFLIVMSILLMNLLYEFRNLELSVVKTFIMMLGELNFDETFLSLEGVQNVKSPRVFRDLIHYNVTTYIMFLGFVVLVPILMMNLLIEFDSVLLSLLKTFVMMIGEFEFAGIFLEDDSSKAYDVQVFLSPATYAIFVCFLIIMSVILMNLLVAFGTFPYSMLKSTVMMIGEFDYGDIFLGDSSSYEGRSFYQVPAIIMFILFVISMTIIIMNLLVGLAVDDIKAVQEQAVLKRLAMQVELALDVEAVVPQFLRRRFFQRTETITPNHKMNPIARMLRGDSSLSSAAITKALDPELDDIEKLEENQEKMMKQITNVRNRMRGMAERNERIESMMRAIMAHHDIDWQEEDGTEDAM